MIAGADQHVVGLDVAVDEPLLVRRVERLGDLREQPQRSPVVEVCCVWISSLSVGPSTIRIARNSLLSASPASYTVTMWGWSSAACSRPSRRKRSRKAGSELS